LNRHVSQFRRLADGITVHEHMIIPCDDFSFFDFQNKQLSGNVEHRSNSLVPH